MNNTIKKALLAALALILLGVATIAVVGYQAKSKIHDIFVLNQQLKSEGYYLSEFEFEMLAAVYRLDHGDYLEGLSILDRVHERFATKRGLVKIPALNDDRAILEFYKNQQNPTTGAFYTHESDPLFAYIGVTANMIEFIEELSAKTDTPFSLKHRLGFLDTINTPAKLTAFMDDVSQVGWIGANLKAPFVCIVELRDLVESAERLGLFSFSPEWKHAFHQWFYDNQDPETGLWGARIRGSGELLNGGEVLESQKVIKIFIDHQGNEKLPPFPVRHRGKIVASTLSRLTAPMPENLDQLHDWVLQKDRGIRFLTRYMWNGASDQQKHAIRNVIDEFVQIRFDKYFIADEGAFSLYPNAAHSDLDGTGEAIGMFDYIGALSSNDQRKLWGGPQETIADLGTFAVRRIERDAFKPVIGRTDVNSIRLYDREPEGSFIEAALGIHYPKNGKVLDIVELLPKVLHWTETTHQKMGNWVTKERILDRIGGINVRPVPVLAENLINAANTILQDRATLVVVGFDVLQVPRTKMVFTRP